MSCKIVCFGETLMDLLPTGPKPGGAPMNVAYHLNQLGTPAAIITRFGMDEMGDQLEAFIQGKGIDAQFVQRDADLPTGTVGVAFDGLEAKYTISEGAAWDNIHTELLPETVELLVHGSLALRSEENRITLQAIKQRAHVKWVFDVNMREPFYSPALITHWMREADVVKLNEHEFKEVCNWFHGQDAQAVMAMFPSLDLLIITRGDKGAAVFTPEEVYEHEGFIVNVIDTVGSGDSFLAAFLHAFYQENLSIPEALAFACATGAFIATQDGANPEYAISDIQLILQRK